MLIANPRHSKNLFPLLLTNSATLIFCAWLTTKVLLFSIPSKEAALTKIKALVDFDRIQISHVVNIQYDFVNVRLEFTKMLPLLKFSITPMTIFQLYVQVIG